MKRLTDWTRAEPRLLAPLAPTPTRQAQYGNSALLMHNLLGLDTWQLVVRCMQTAGGKGKAP
ncbi:hypothetical protein [Streptomyces noursei]|uniref:hypothetical protein n=1 Tax=Streptomyces noursei TaxID=1971 RepID=UPI0037F8CCCC